MNDIVLITGASGTLAKVVAKNLEMNGYEVLFYSSNIYINLTRILHKLYKSLYAILRNPIKSY